MTDAPERIWASNTSLRDPCGGLWKGDDTYGVPYILATPAALAAAPEVQALVEAAVRRALEKAAWKSTSFLVGDLPNLRNPMPHQVADAIRALAADTAEVRKIAEGRG